MKTIALPCVVLLVLVQGNVAPAGGLISQFPIDGAWVRYQWSLLQGGGEVTGTLTISSVGTSTKNNQKSRWLELKLNYDEGTVKHAFLAKLLVNEQDIVAQADLMQSASQVWLRVDDQAPIQRLSPRDAPEWLNRTQRIFRHVALPMRDLGKLDEKTVEFQRGKLECSGRKQEFLGPATKVTINGVPAELKSSYTQAVWLHKDVPFGVATCESRMDLLHDGQSTKSETVKFLLSDFGTDAKTELPDQN
jgi:hypothetical protein